MSTKIILVGGLLDDISHDALISRLVTEIPDKVAWAWVWSRQAEQYQPSHKAMMRLLDQLRKWLVAREKSDLGGPVPDPESLIVVKLFDLHGRAANQLFSVWSDPVQVPAEVRTSGQIVEWLRSPDAAIFPRLEWLAGITEAAVVAILCKLLKNKDWNANVQGHQWTREIDLLNQAPVRKSDLPQVAIEAGRILDSLSNSILLTKGSNQGKSPKEWSINIRYLPQIKRAILEGSLAGLADIESFDGVLRKIEQQERSIDLVDGIVSERVREVCRSQS